MASSIGIRAAKAFVEIGAKDGELRKSLTRIQRRLKAFGSSVKAIGMSMAKAAVPAGTLFGISAAKFVEFDDAMRTVKAVTGATNEEFAALTEQARQLGATTSFTAAQVANLQTELGRAGFNPKEIEQMTASVLNLSRATGTDAAEAAGIAAASIRQFGADAAEMGRFADILTAGANKSFNTLETLGNSLNYAGPVAADFNMSFEDTVALLGALGNVGIQGSAAGTAIRRVLAIVATEGEKIQKITGKATTDAAGNARPLIDVLAEIDAATKNLGTADRGKIFADLFGLRGITAASALGKNALGVESLRQAIQSSIGSLSEETANQMDAGLGGSWRRLMSSVEGLLISIGDAISGPLNQFSEQLQRISSFVIDWVKNNEGLVKSILMITAGVAAGGVALVGLGAAMTALSFVVGGLSAAIGLLLSPIGIATAALVAFFTMTDHGRQMLQDLQAAVGPVFEGIANALKAGDLALAAEIGFQGIETAWVNAISFLQEKWLDFRVWLADSLTDIGKKIRAKISGLFGVDPKYLENFSKSVRSVFGEIDAVKATFGESIRQDAKKQREAIAAQRKSANDKLERLTRKAEKAAQKADSVHAGDESERYDSDTLAQRAMAASKATEFLAEAQRGTFSGTFAQRLGSLATVKKEDQMLAGINRIADATESLDSKSDGGGLVFD